MNNVNMTINLLDKLGFTIHPEKSILSPTQKLSFLGFKLNSLNMTITLLPEKKLDLKRECERFVKKREATIREFARIIGKLVAAEPGVQYASLYIKNLEIVKDALLKQYQGDFDGKFTVSDDIRFGLQWWINNIDNSFKPVTLNDPSVTLQTDSSGTGWGCVVVTNNQQTGGHWSYVEQKSHINLLELKAAFLGLQTFCAMLSNIHIRIQMDNMVAVSYINNMGGRKNDLTVLTKEIWEWCIYRKLWVSAVHLPGIDNIHADRLSRKLNDDLEWALNRNIFRQIANIYHINNDTCVDMFASRLNYQLEKYVSFLPDPKALAIDAFSVKWNNHIVYLFPPFSVIGQVLRKVEEDKAEAILIAPLWTTQSWWPKIMGMIAMQSYIIPRQCKTLTMPTDSERRHPLRKMWLGCFRLSGNRWKVQTYQTKLSRLLERHGDHLHRNNIGVISKDGCTFVTNSRLIHLKHL